VRFGDGEDADAKTAFILNEPGQTVMRGVSMEYGSFGRHFGLVILGLGYIRNGRPWHVNVDNPTPGGEELDVRGDFLHLRTLQPQFRYALWRAVLTIQVGLEVRGGLVKEVNGNIYNDGFAVIDLHAGGRIHLRAYIVAGFYLQAAYRHSFALVGTRSAAGELSASFHGWSFGMGYGF
jgi:hypothetical protein